MFIASYQVSQRKRKTRMGYGVETPLLLEVSHKAASARRPSIPPLPGEERLTTKQSLAPEVEPVEPEVGIMTGRKGEEQEKKL